MSKENLELRKFSPIDKQGFMNKQGGSWKSWKKRWFVLNGETLYYFESNKPDAVPKGSINLVGAAIKQMSMSKANTFAIGVTARTYVMSCDTPDDYEKWFEACTAVAAGNIEHYRNRITDPNGPDMKIKINYDPRTMTEGLVQLAKRAIKCLVGVTRVELSADRTILSVYGGLVRACDVLDSLEMSGVDCELLAVKPPQYSA